MRQEIVKEEILTPASGFRNGDTVTREEVERLRQTDGGENVVVVQKPPPYFMIGSFIIVGLAMVLSALNYWFTMAQEAAEREAERAHELALRSHDMAERAITSLAEVAGVRVESSQMQELFVSGFGYALLAGMVFLTVILSVRKMVH